MNIPGGTLEAEACREEIREFHEPMPYPAPVARLDEHPALYADPQRRRALFHRTWPNERPGEPQAILLAGCRPAQAARTAMREPNSRVTAIDSSVRRLLGTRDLQRKHALHNLEVQRLALENVRELDRTFDLILCIGVLHHLPDPDRGLRALHDVLRPKGALQLMVHASRSRTTNTPINPRDRGVTVPQLYAWLERAGMSFGRWTEQAPYLPQCGAMAGTSYSEQLNALPAPAQHAAAESFRGSMTRHSLIAYRSDYSGAGQSINFKGERWRDYVPIRLPWTLSIRKGIPTGSAAVLLNPTHKHRDLLLPVTWAQDRLLAAIDGTRTLGEIVTACGTSKGAQRALQFFERLYYYDQIVFDASSSGASVSSS
jgi:SAM-dependent methyltransferase